MSLLRHNLWPATPIKPEFAISIALLDIIFEQVVVDKWSLQKSSRSLERAGHRHLNSRHFKPRLYLELSRYLSFEKYRTFRQSIDYLSGLNESAELVFASKMVCYGCPLVGARTFAGDACFGFKNFERLSKQIQCEATEFVEDQRLVNDFVKKCEIDDHGMLETDTEKSCANFNAGSYFKKGKAKLGVQAMFGTCCKHDAVIKLLDMKHHERYCYPWLMLKNIKEELPPGITKLNFLYDVS